VPISVIRGDTFRLTLTYGKNGNSRRRFSSFNGDPYSHGSNAST
jgi:hypothetical protein